MKFLVCIIILAIHSLAKCSAMPMAYMNLMDFIAYSPSIVVADVRSNVSDTSKFIINEQHKKMFLFGARNIKISILENIKGSVLPKELSIYTDGIVCPSDADFPDSGIVLIFLDTAKYNGKYSCFRRGQGLVRIESAGQLKSYRTMIKEALLILKNKDKVAAEKAYINWVYQCTIDPYMRSRGMAMLFTTKPEGLDSFQSVYRYQIISEVTDRLGVKQRVILKSLFLNAATIDEYNLRLSLLFKKEEYGKVCFQLLKRLPKATLEVQDQIVERYLELDPNKDLWGIHNELEDLNHAFDYNGILNPEYRSKHHKLVNKFLHLAKTLN